MGELVLYLNGNIQGYFVNSFHGIQQIRCSVYTLTMAKYCELFPETVRYYMDLISGVISFFEVNKPLEIEYVGTFFIEHRF